MILKQKVMLLTGYVQSCMLIKHSVFLAESSSSSKKGTIIGGAAGGASLVLLIVGLFVWFKLSKKRKAAPRGKVNGMVTIFTFHVLLQSEILTPNIVAGNILDATELRGATIYSFKDLKSATKNFKEENKLGEGGFGDVYKVK